MAILNDDVLLIIFNYLGPGYSRLLANICVRWQSIVKPRPPLTAGDIAWVYRLDRDPVCLDFFSEHYDLERRVVDIRGSTQAGLSYSRSEEEAATTATVVSILLFGKNTGVVKTRRAFTTLWRSEWPPHLDPEPSEDERVAPVESLQ